MGSASGAGGQNRQFIAVDGGLAWPSSALPLGMCFTLSLLISPWDLLGVFIHPEEYKGIVNSQRSLLSCGCTSCSLPRGCASLPSGQEK